MADRRRGERAMNSALLPLALATLLTASHGPRVFLSVDRTFLPDQPGSLLRVEMEGSHTLDLRLYQLKDPERFLTPGRGEEGPGLRERVSPDSPRSPSPTSVMAGRAASVRKGARIQPAGSPQPGGRRCGTTAGTRRPNRAHARSPLPPGRTALAAVRSPLRRRRGSQLLRGGPRAPSGRHVPR